MRLRKKPVVIDGFQMTAQRMRFHTLAGWPTWALRAVGTPPNTAGRLCQENEDVWYVWTREGGRVRVNVDDWILRGVKGELYPCKPDVLALTYDVLGPDKEET